MRCFAAVVQTRPNFSFLHTHVHKLSYNSAKNLNKIKTKERTELFIEENWFVRTVLNINGCQCRCILSYVHTLTHYTGLFLLFFFYLSLAHPLLCLSIRRNYMRFSVIIYSSQHWTFTFYFIWMSHTIYLIGLNFIERNFCNNKIKWYRQNWEVFTFHKNISFSSFFFSIWFSLL